MPELKLGPPAIVKRHQTPSLGTLKPGAFGY
ncbi:hypothetical protein J831_4604, partial [Acinetobacter baumannii 25691_8]